LVSLLTGDYQEQPLMNEFMEVILENDLNSQMWFFLKLASYVHPSD
jgi:hypothetical protein